jgi:prepilin signal peptidase PulO-like enzyme (type II secretory pathway)
MLFLNLLILFILGTIIGSFLNVVVLRYGTGLSFVTGRSRCFSCSKDLHWYELIPLFSFLMLCGKCLKCKSKISIQYPIVEFITGVVFVGVFLRFGMSPMLPLYLLISSLLISMSIYDFIHQIIPDGMVFSFIALSLVVLFLTHPLSELLAFPISFDLLSGPLLFSFLAFLWLVSGGKWMGLGDAKLVLGMGWLLGFSGGIFAMISAFWIGAIVSIIILLLQKISTRVGSTSSGKTAHFKLSFKSAIAFGPFIVFALFLQLFTAWNLHSLMYFLG